MTKKRLFLIVVFTATIVLSLLSIAYSKHYIKYSARYKLTTLKTPYYPDAYRFINTKEDLEVCIESVNDTVDVKNFIESNKIDFRRYSYVMVFGAPIKEMYYSLKTTIFDDKSPSYAKAIKYNKKCVFIKYAHPTGYIYIYRIKKDLSLTGFNGI